MKHVKRRLAMLLSIAMVFSLMTGVGAPRVSAAEEYALTMKSAELIPFYKNINSSPNNTPYEGAESLTVPLSATTSANDELETGYYVKAYVTWYESPSSSSGLTYTYAEPTWTLEPAGVVEISWDFSDYVVYGESWGAASIKLNPLKTGTTTLTWKCGSFERSITIRVVDTMATNMTLSSSAIYLTQVGEQYQLTPTITPANAYQGVTYTISDTSVATVSDTGVVTAVATGRCLIYAYADGGNGIRKPANVYVTLAEDASPIMAYRNPNDMTLEVGATDYVPYDKCYTDAGATIPCKAADFTYESEDPSVATVDSNGLITAVSEGTTEITYTAINQTMQKVSLTFTVTVTAATGTEVAVESVSVSPTSTQLKVGNTLSLSASVSPSNATNKAISWSSSNPSVVTVTDSLIRAVAPGTATITATSAADATKYAQCTVTVEADVVLVNSVSVTPATLSLTKGMTSQLTAAVLPDNAGNKNLNWTSSNPAVATVNAAGLVTAVSSGTATIKATAADGSGKYGSCVVTVKTPVTGLLFSQTPVTLQKNGTIDLSDQLTISPSDADNKTLTWSSSDSNYASVSEQGVVTILKDSGTMQNVTVNITAATTDGSDKSATFTITIAPIKVTSMELSASELSLTKDESVNLSVANMMPSNATVQTVSWSSSDLSVATVDSTGKVTVVSDTAGQTAVITATADGGENVTASCRVTVISADSKVPVESVTLNPSTAQQVKVGGEIALQAAVTPADATTQGVNWYITSGEGTVISKISSDSGQCNIQAVAPGVAVVEAQAIGDSTKKASITITVTAIEVTSISVSPAAKDMTVGDTYKATATVLPANATDKTVTWQTSSAAVATVDQNGTITAVAAGEATITATAGSQSATIKITVQPVSADPDTPVAVTGITVSPTTKAMTVGEVYKATATVLPANATDKTVTWKSSNTTVATVDQSGTITARAAGNATITATAGNKSATLTVTVKTAAVEPVTPSDPVVPTEKKTQTITAKTSYTKVYGAKAFSLGAKTNGDGKLTYTTSNKKIATVSSTGKVTIKGTGKVTITITAAETSAYKSAALKVTVTVKPKKATLKKLASKKKSQLTVKWKKDAKATGYEITVATNKKFTKNKKTVTVKSYKKTSTTIKKLKSKKTYYVRIRSYKTVNGKKVYGAYSKILKIKVK